MTKSESLSANPHPDPPPEYGSTELSEVQGREITPPRKSGDKPTHPRQRRWPTFALSLPLLALLIVPIIALILRTPLASLGSQLLQPATAQAIELSLITSAIAVAITLLFGTPLAILLSRGPFPGRTLLDICLDLPTVLPPAVAGIALLMMLGRHGLLGPLLEHLGIELPFTPAAVVLAQTFVAAPYFIKTAVIAFSAVPHDIREAASLDGATPAQSFWYITIPVARRGLTGGAALCWARALGEFGATIIFAGNFPGRTQTMPLAIYMGFQIDLPQALALSVVLLAVSFAMLAAIRVGPRQGNQ